MQAVSHYENFPVASWLCPAHLRSAVIAIYGFARTADDIADEGHATAPERLLTLARYRQALQHTLLHPKESNTPMADADARWRPVFEALRVAVTQHQLPVQPLFDLLDAFEQDIRYTAGSQRYPSLTELLDYCSRSANPVGRLLLHLYGVGDAESLRQSDHICTALQLINFWQDLGQDLARQRHYLPEDLLAQFGVDSDRLRLGAVHHADTLGPDDEAARALLAHLVQDARLRMLAGAPLALRVPGRAGWELRLVVQGGLRILERIEFHQHRTWRHRPKLRPADVALMLWRACWMRPHP